MQSVADACRARFLFSNGSGEISVRIRQSSDENQTGTLQTDQRTRQELILNHRKSKTLSLEMSEKEQMLLHASVQCLGSPEIVLLNQIETNSRQTVINTSSNTFL